MRKLLRAGIVGGTIATLGTPARTLAAEVQARPSDSLVDTIGVNIHVWETNSPYYTRWQDVIDRIHDIGIRQVRDHAVEVDRLNMLTDQYGIKVDAIVQQWQGLQRWVDDLSRLDPLLDNAKQLHGLEYLEGPNEYDQQGDPNWESSLRPWVQQMYIRAKADPALANIPILAPTLSAPSATVLADLYPYVDRGNMHSYTAGFNPTWGLQNHIHDAQIMAQNKPIVASEIGWHDNLNEPNPQPFNFGVEEHAVGKYIPRTFMEYFNRGVEKTFVYELLDDHPEPTGTYGEDHYGMLRNDLSYKPSAIATKNLISMLSEQGAAFTPQPLDFTLSSAPYLQSTLLQKRDGRYYLAVWRDDWSYNNIDRQEITPVSYPVTLTLATPMNLRSYLLGNIDAPVQVGNASTQFTVNVSDEVMLIELSGPGARWNISGGGTWSNSGNWTSSVPGGAGSVARFDGNIAGGQTITLDGPRTVGEVSFDSASHYTIAGTSALTMQGSGSPALMTVFSGDHTIATPIVLAGSTAIDVEPAGSTLTLTGDMSGAGNLTKMGAGKVEVKHVRAGDLTISQGAMKVTPNGSAGGVSKVGALSVASGATIDLTDNKLITTTPAGSWNGTAYNGVTGQIQSGRNGGAPAGKWTGSGIVTSSAANDLTTLGVATAAQIFGISTTSTALWAGQTVAGSDTLVMYTYGGDANLDGKINVDDYTRIDFNVALGSTGWFNGDFNYDGKINIDDYTIIDFNVQVQGAPFSTAFAPEAPSLSAVPEPGALTLITSAVACVIARRRKRSSKTVG